MADQKPVIFFDRELPAEYRDLVEGRAIAVGPDDADLSRAQAIVAGSVRRYNAAFFASAPSVRVVSRSGVGYDNVDVADARAANVVVCYTPEGPTVSTAEHTMALMLAITKDLPAQQAAAAAGLPPASSASPSLELDGRVLGIIGLGRIARRVATAATALGMKVIAHDPYLKPGDVAYPLVSLDELLGSADVVTLHAPATAATEHLINATTLALMKPGAYLVNCARGGLVDQDALIGALNSGRLAGAALDVTTPEPLPVGHPLLVHPKVIVTPHIASSTGAGRRRLYEQAIDNALAVLSGRPASVVPG